MPMTMALITTMVHQSEVTLHTHQLQVHLQLKAAPQLVKAQLSHPLNIDEIRFETLLLICLRYHYYESFLSLRTRQL